METTQDFIRRLQLINKKAGNFTEAESDVFVFCFLLIGYLEKTIQKTLYEILLDSQREEVRYPALIDYLLKERNFGEKINIMRFLARGNKEVEENFKDFIGFCETINYGIRNNLFHFKIDELKYKEKDVRLPETQAEIMKDFGLISGKLLKSINDTISK